MRTSSLLFRLPLVPMLLAGIAPLSAAPPVIEDPGTVLSNLVDVTTGLPIGIQMQASENPTSWSATGLPGGFSIDSETGLIQGISATPLSSTITVFAANSDGTGQRTITLNVTQRDTDLERGVDVSTSPGDNRLAPIIQNPGNGIPFWFRATGGGINNDVVRTTANLPNNSSVGMRAYVQGPCEVTFAWRVLSEENYDFLNFYVDGFLVDRISGTTVFSYVDVSVDLPQGLHELDWIYTKDESLSDGLDTGFLDNVRITGYPVWAAQKNLNPFNSDFAIDKDRDHNTLMTEYALALNPNKKETVVPGLSFEPDGRAVVEIGKNPSAAGVTVELEENRPFMPATWSSAGLETLVDSNSLLRKREMPASPGKNLFRVNVTSP
ncbi:MAG: hypothetical protein HKN82_13255 [Akkermansiaceae bacterium]|nr:hypothetical protein [Akkermansiaceae bacterium]NNM28161.1 hypothetical protein [Akkermansiaceae bacterium]